MNTATFSTASLDSKLGPIDLVERTLVGKKISFTSPNTINLEPGNYVVNYTLMGNPAGPNETVLVGLDINGLAIPEATIGSASYGTELSYSQAAGSYSLNVPTSSTLQLNSRTNVLYDVPGINAILAANNAQTAQITIYEV
ncbi:hypothetical protein [Bacillus cereus]|uniref:hypothetical protein n=1 Tax=Bacillus cereus TaxID=1396 RepID=UPI000BECCBCD|nr:hypothetical protein [Bacillus cereus]PEA01794.1 hypothetical protein CON37_25915 [Bacillus cereus]